MVEENAKTATERDSSCCPRKQEKPPEGGTAHYLGTIWSSPSPCFEGQNPHFTANTCGQTLVRASLGNHTEIGHDIHLTSGHRGAKSSSGSLEVEPLPAFATYRNNQREPRSAACDELGRQFRPVRCRTEQTFPAQGSSPLPTSSPTHHPGTSTPGRCGR